MVSGFDKYFQIAPCFRDEDARADRSPGEFYQLDIEMSFVEQEDVFEVVEKLMVNLFTNFSKKKMIYKKFPRIPFKVAMDKYGTDKPDLRNPLIIFDISKIFNRDDVKFEIFKKLLKSGSLIKAIITKKTNTKPRSFFDNIDKWAKEQGWSGLAYFSIEKDENNKILGKGPVGKFFSEDAIKEIMKITSAEIGDSIFMSCSKENEIFEIMSKSRSKIAEDLNIINENSFASRRLQTFQSLKWIRKQKK
jgi:Aspartyl-tRNA synthetase